MKPEFFQHERLYDAELTTGLPLRVAFVGLWCAADREGRFEWRPRALKANILPFDDLDFENVLNALAEFGFVLPYDVKEKRYGVIPSFPDHQVINNKEGKSLLPPPPRGRVWREPRTPKPRVPDASPTRANLFQVEGKGKEGNGREQFPADAGDWVRVLASDWKTAYQGEPAYGVIGKQLKKLIDAHGLDPVRSNWQRYLAGTEARFASPARFAQTYGAWAPPPAVVPRVTRDVAIRRALEVLTTLDEKRIPRDGFQSDEAFQTWLAGERERQAAA